MTSLTIDQCKAIAQAQAEGNDFTVFAGEVYACEWDTTFRDFIEHNTKMGNHFYNDDQVQAWLEETECKLEYDEGGDYIVLDDSEADEKAKEHIEDSLWAFNASFLSGVTGFDEEIFKAIQDNDKCESNNNAILQLVTNNPNNSTLDDLVSEAISANGRGHFLNTYDGNEEEFNCFEYTGKNEYLYVFRIN